MRTGIKALLRMIQRYVAFSLLFCRLFVYYPFLFYSWQPIMKFINEQYEQYLQEEININRKKRIPDSRVHCCIYFIPPTGHWSVQFAFLNSPYFLYMYVKHDFSCFSSLNCTTLTCVYMWHLGKTLFLHSESNKSYLRILKKLITL